MSEGGATNPGAFHTIITIIQGSFNCEVWAIIWRPLPARSLKGTVKVNVQTVLTMPEARKAQELSKNRPFRRKDRA
jgi:hypothetical protein